MNFANLKRSKRLRRVQVLLQDGRQHSTLDIIRQANVCAVNSIVSELRMNGLDIGCQRKGDIWFYQLRRAI